MIIKAGNLVLTASYFDWLTTYISLELKAIM